MSTKAATIVQNNETNNYHPAVSLLLGCDRVQDRNDLVTQYPAVLQKSIMSSALPSDNLCNDGAKKTHQIAKKRWKMLAKVLQKDILDAKQSLEDKEDIPAASIRRFKSFNILELRDLEEILIPNLLGKQENWYSYKIQTSQHQDFHLNIHHIDRQFTAKDLIGFNNTGNICIWPSEEALTVYVLSKLESFQKNWVLELGGGMTCLAGMMLAKYANPYLCHLTDGNCESVENIRKTIFLNELSCYTKCSVLKWENTNTDDKCGGSNQARFEQFDTILSADCLFFDDVRRSLVDTIWYYLAPTGVALVMAPKRGHTMSQFVEICIEKGFQCQIEHQYNERIWQRHLELKKLNYYNEDIHYPVLLILTKMKSITNTTVNC